MTKNCFVGTNLKLVLYGIVPGQVEAVPEELEPVNHNFFETIRPCLERREGPSPKDPEVGFAIKLLENTARVCFFWHARVIATGAVAWGPGAQTKNLWRWICTSQDENARIFPAPDTVGWAAVAVPLVPLPAAPNKIFGAYDTMRQLAPALIHWVGLQN